MRYIVGINVFLTLLFLAGCGQKGPLYFPPPSSDTASTQAAPG